MEKYSEVEVSSYNPCVFEGVGFNFLFIVFGRVVKIQKRITKEDFKDNKVVGDKV